MKLLLTLSLLCGFAAALFGAGECLIVTSDGRRISTTSVTAKPNGDLEYVSPENSALRVRIPKGRYRYAWVPKPADVTEADAKYKAGDYKSAAELYLKAYLNYRNLGWDIYCMTMEADTLDRLGMTRDAIAKLEGIKTARVLNPELENDYQRAMFLLASLYRKTENAEGAEQLLKKVSQSRDGELAASAFMARAEILAERGNRKDAANLYFQTVLLFPKSRKHPEALYRTYENLKLLNDARAEKFAERLRTEYPDDPFAKRLK